MRTPENVVVVAIVHQRGRIVHGIRFRCGLAGFGLIGVFVRSFVARSSAAASPAAGALNGFGAAGAGRCRAWSRPTPACLSNLKGV